MNGAIQKEKLNLNLQRRNPTLPTKVIFMIKFEEHSLRISQDLPSLLKN